MASSRRGLRGIVLVEDVRARDFVWALLREIGFRVKRFRFEVTPRGKGAGEAWVLHRYPDKVRWLRSNRHQKGLRLVVHRDGDNLGTARRKQQLDSSLVTLKLQQRGADEPIALLVPTWSIETWLLALLGQDGVDESRSLKAEFERRASPEAADLRLAARAFSGEVGADLPSLVDGRAGMRRLDP